MRWIRIEESYKDWKRTNTAPALKLVVPTQALVIQLAAPPHCTQNIAAERTTLVVIEISTIPAEFRDTTFMIQSLLAGLLVPL